MLAGYGQLNIPTLLKVGDDLGRNVNMGFKAAIVCKRGNDATFFNPFPGVNKGFDNKSVEGCPNGFFLLLYQLPVEPCLENGRLLLQAAEPSFVGFILRGGDGLLLV